MTDEKNIPKVVDLEHVLVPLTDHKARFRNRELALIMSSSLLLFF